MIAIAGNVLRSAVPTKIPSISANNAYAMGTMPHISKRFVKVKFWLSCNALVIEKAHQESRPNSIPKTQSTTLESTQDLATNPRYHRLPRVQIVRYVPA